MMIMMMMKSEEEVNFFSIHSDIMYSGMWLQFSKWTHCSIFHPVGGGIMFIQDTKE
jgi:hypothetical protein